MQETIQKYRDKAIEYWKGLTKQKKISLVLITIAVIAGLVFLINFLTRVEYKILYSGLSLKDQSKIITKLDELGVSYKTDGNSNILVPADKVSKTRIDLAGANLPSSRYDYDSMFQDTSWSQTEFDKSVRLKRWKEATLQESIEAIEGISAATVILTIPENTNFILSEQEVLPSASVWIEWDGGGSRRNEIVKAIQNLVASSTVKLTADSVTVIDNEGNTLSSGSGESLISSEAYALASKYESIYDQKIRNQLERVFGRGNVAVMTSVIVNMDLKKQVEHKFAPPIEGEDEGLVRSNETLEENMRGASATGVPGTETNVEDYEIEGNDNSVYSKKSALTNRELNEVQTEIRTTPGQIENVSVSVIINQKALQGGELSEEEKAEYTEIVKAAVGSNATKVNVVAKDFADPEGPEEATGITANLLIPLIIAGLLLLLVIVGIILKVRSNKKKQRELELAEEQRLKELAEKKSMEESEELEFTAEDSNMKKQIIMFIEQKPEAVSQLLRNWLNE